MISKKTTKDRNTTKKVSSLKVENRKPLITSRRRAATKSPSISGVKQRKSAVKINLKSNKQNKTTINKRTKAKKSQESSSSSIGSNVKLRLSLRKENTTNKSTKIKKIKKIKEIAKKIKTKASNKLGKVAKRKLRNNTKRSFDEKKMKSLNNNDKTRLSKQCYDTDTDKFNSKNGSLSPIPNSKSLCNKLFALNCVKSSNKAKKSENTKNKLKPNSKNETKKSFKKEEKVDKSVTNKKVNVKDKKQKKKKSVNTKKKSNSSTKVSNNKKVQNKTQKKSENVSNDSNSIKAKIKPNKADIKLSNKDKLKKSFKNGSSVKRGHRLASLNAIAKVRLLCENEREKSDTIEESNYYEKQNCKREKDDRKCSTKSNSNNKRESKKDSKALVAVKNSNKQLAVRKRKLIDDSIEIIDTRSCKRMASLNASAIMAASYSPERIKRSKSVESTHSNSSVEMVREMQISSTVSRFEISPSVNGINGVHVSEAKSVILKAQKHETIETVKKLKVSSKIRDRLLGIARLERDEKAKKKRKGIQSNHCISDDNESITDDVSSGEVAGFQATKVQVTKVTQINTSQGMKLDKDKKSGHKIESILERDSSVVHKYQVQTKSTIQMQTTFNPSNASSLANVTTISSPQMPVNGSTPRMQVHISAAPAQVIPTPILSTSSTGQPTYFNFPGPAPVLQLHNNQYQAMASSASHVNPMSIINLSEPYPTHYSSAFSVPHFATHTHPQTPFNYFHPGLYQPAGPLLQPFHDSCLIHKPIPFHPQTPQVSHVHSTQNNQTFQNEMTQPFAPTNQFFQQLQSSMRPQTVFFQALPQTNASMTPNATFTLVNPNLHYTQPTIINTEQYAQNENQLLTNDMTYLNSNSKMTTAVTTNTNPSVAQSSHDNYDNFKQHLCKGIQCSPQSKDKLQTISENQFRDSTNQSIRISQNINSNNNKTPPTVVTVRPQITKTSNKADNSDKRKKSLLLKSTQIPKSDDLVMVRNNSQVLIAEHQPEVSAAKSLKIGLTPSNLNKNNSINKTSSQHKNTKTICVQVNTALPSVGLPSSPSLSSSMPRLLPSRKTGKKRYSHGWSWEGDPHDKYVYLNNEEQSYLRKCYPAIRHNEGDIIKVRDCVLLRSGPRKTDLPFVAKIAALWETPEGEMMMSLLWYYRPEHTDLEYYSNQMLGEIFASKHRDTNSVACIDDKCYVLTYNEFCRYKRLKLLKQSPASLSSLSSTIVPPLDEPYPRVNRLPPMRVFPELVFCCRKVYDYRQKRILKNPI